MASPPLQTEDVDFGRDWIAPYLPDEEGPALPPATKRNRRLHWLKRALQALVLLFILLLAWLAVTAPLSKSLEPIAPPQLTLLASDGQPIARKGAIMDQPVRAALLPEHVKQAFIAIEDRRFYSHFGVDPRGIARAGWSNLRGSGPKQGGSTITQQLAKITFLTPERSFTRKAREMLIAFWLEAWLTKDEILERYLSNVYFGDNIYGLRAASLHYFYRQPERLTIAQAAMLAGLVQAPSRLAPTKNPEAARRRADMVLAAMVDTGSLTRQEVEALDPARLDRRIRTSIPTGTYFADWALPQARAVAEEQYGNQEILTTLDARLQRIARGVVGRSGAGGAQVSLVAMRTNGEVVAMIGGRSYEKSPFNRATQARRQPGSTFKLFVYLAALRAGLSPDSFVDDSPITIGTYRPRNSGDRYRGQITLREAFARSSNVAAVRLYRQLGDEAVVKAARDLGIRSPLAADPSLALGTSGVTLLELTSAYAAVAAGRYPVKPHAIPEPEPGFFGRLFGPSRRLGSSTQEAMLDLLAAPIKQGTGTAARLGIDAYGKTGTSQDNRDALFIGFAEDLVVGVWIGNDDNKPLRGINGGNLPARIWRDFMSQAIRGAAPPRPEPKDAEPEDLRDLEIPPIDLGNGSITLGNDSSISLDTDIGGVGVNMKLDREGVSFDTRPSEERPPEPAPAKGPS